MRWAGPARRLSLSAVAALAVAGLASAGQGLAGALGSAASSGTAVVLNPPEGAQGPSGPVRLPPVTEVPLAPGGQGQVPVPVAGSPGAVQDLAVAVLPGGPLAVTPAQYRAGGRAPREVNLGVTDPRGTLAGWRLLARLAGGGRRGSCVMLKALGVGEAAGEPGAVQVGPGGPLCPGGVALVAFARPGHGGGSYLVRLGVRLLATSRAREGRVVDFAVQ